MQGALGPVFADFGFVTLAIDLPGFGERATASESALAKARLWRGRTLAGQMLGELASALGWLASRSDVDARRVGAFGISMGATLGYWLAAVDPRIACVAHLCCFADFDRLIETGAHDLHGIYLTIPGLSRSRRTAEIAGLIAPRPQLIGIGDLDPLTPPHAVDPALATVRAAYAEAGASENLALVRQADVGHQESPEMRAAVLAFFRRHLRRRLNGHGLAVTCRPALSKTWSWARSNFRPTSSPEASGRCPVEHGQHCLAALQPGMDDRLRT